MRTRIDRMDYREIGETSPFCGRTSHDRALAAYLWERKLDGNEGEDERTNEAGDGCTRYGRRVLEWDGRGFICQNRYDSVEAAQVAMLDAFPLSFDEALEALADAPGMVELVAGFGVELDGYTDVLTVGFVVCEALRTVAHDWGYYRLAAALNALGYRPAAASADDESWLAEDSHGEVAPLTEAEAQREVERLEADGLDSWRWAQLHTVGSRFYRDGTEAEALQLVAALAECFAAADRDGIEAP